MLLSIVFYILCFSILLSVLAGNFSRAENSSKYKNIFLLIPVLMVIFYYFFLSNNFYHGETFFPGKNPYYYHVGNLYNMLIDSFKNGRLYIDVGNELLCELFQDKDFCRNYIYYLDAGQTGDYQDQYVSYCLSVLWDMSFYNGKIFLYFGITPVLLFYLPFHFLTGLYLTDKFLVFVLSSLIFVISLFLSRQQVYAVGSRQSATVLSIFLIGVCNLSPFLVIRSATYEVAIVTAFFLLLTSCLLFYMYIDKKYFSYNNIILFFMALFLSLAVGARPHYVLFIPLFFCAVLLVNKNKDKKFILKQTIIFLIPCLFYGAVIALYNYLRFDSIFNFGFKYQLNGLNIYEYTPHIKHLLTGLKNNLFLFPQTDFTTVFSLAQTSGHRLSNEAVTGIIWMCPIILLLVFLPMYLKKLYKENRNFFIFISLLTCIILINIIVTGFFGMVMRYLFEYLALMVILSVIVFNFLYNEVKSVFVKHLLTVFFVLITCYSLYANTALLLSEKNSVFYALVSGFNYLKITGFLF